KTYKT
ncbi:ACT domain protein, partial [Vibrio parahaemolyticus VP2007-007]